MAKKRVALRNLKTNMIVANDVYTLHDQLIIPQHTVLNEEIIERLRSYSIPFVIIDEDQVPPEKIFSALDGPTLSERIQESKEFIEFKKVYKKQAASFKKMLDSAVFSETPLDTQELLETSMSLLAQARNSLHIFDILHNMHETDDVTYAHSINVSLLSVIIGQWVGFSKDDLDTLCVGGLLHDVGKLLIRKVSCIKKEDYLPTNMKL
jgi:HD-GYP domain-containing protein (c-di-GMP phosphodiesterase class II)